jgi:glucose dehydrogenase
MSNGDDNIDVAVVGSGVAGAIIAQKLALLGLRVVVLEAGSQGADRASMVQTFALAASKTTRSPYNDVGDKSPVVSPQGDSDYEQGGPFHYKSGYLRRVGGTTWHMLGNMPRHLPADFKLHSRYGVGVDWPISYDDLETWYGKAETELGVSGDHEELDGLHGAYRSSPFPMTKIWLSYGDLHVTKAIDGLAVDGRPVKLMSTPQARNSRPYDGRPACAGNSSCVPICPIGAKYDASVHVGKAVEAGAELRQHAVVSRIVLDPATSRVQSLEYFDWSAPTVQKRSLSAKIIVIAAQAIEAPRLLLLSTDAATAPQGVANGSGEVGKNLMDHLQGQVACLVADPIFGFRGPPTTSGIDEFRDGDFRSERAAFRMSIGNDGMARIETPIQTMRNLLDTGLLGKELATALRENASRHFRISYSTEQLPAASNCVTLSDKPERIDKFGLRLPKVSVGLSDYNRAAFAQAQRVIGMIFDRLGATRRIPPTDIDSYTGAGHIMGTTRMGLDPATSVVNRDCRAHQHDNLYIVGSSVFPTAGTANPTLTVAALALRAADTIGARMRKGA